MRDRTNDRKVAHIAIIDRDQATDRRRYYFDDIRLTHRALPELDLKDVDPAVDFLGKRLSFPLIISSMTGGDHATVRAINRRLAEAAEAEGVAMAVGSQRVMFTHPAARASFDLRRHAPTTVLCANLGAVQLNHGFGLHEAQAAVAILQADGLYLHLNPLQEAVQPEGDTDFGGLAERIGALARKLTVPVLVKEVGAGLSRADAELLVRQGIRYLDVAGSGGTSWSRIEAHRHGGASGAALGVLFQDWGIPTPLALKSLNTLKYKAVRLVASGGIRSGLDMAKAVVLGASLCGLAAPFLKPAQTSAQAVRREIRRLRREFVTAMFLLGQRTVGGMRGRRTLVESSPWA
jgi:isopentenyl-diphosphate delta-isomerase